MTALAWVSLNQIDDPFSLPRGHSNVRAWDPPRLQRDRWDLVCHDLAEVIFLPGPVCCFIIKGAVAINIGRILQRHCLLGQNTIRVKKNHSSGETTQRRIVWQMVSVMWAQFGSERSLEVMHFCAYAASSRSFFKNACTQLIYSTLQLTTPLKHWAQDWLSLIQSDQNLGDLPRLSDKLIKSPHSAAVYTHSNLSYQAFLIPSRFSFVLTGGFVLLKVSFSFPLSPMRQSN